LEIGTVGNYKAMIYGVREVSKCDQLSRTYFIRLHNLTGVHAMVQRIARQAVRILGSLVRMDGIAQKIRALRAEGYAKFRAFSKG